MDNLQEWMKGYWLYQLGASESKCANYRQLQGWYEALYIDVERKAMQGEAGILPDDEFVYIHDESSIEDDYEWIRRGC